jgi:hypothetical protein
MSKFIIFLIVVLAAGLLGGYSSGSLPSQPGYCSQPGRVTPPPGC